MIFNLLKLCFSFISLLAVMVCVESLPLKQTPTDVTCLTGDTVMFQCLPAVASDILTWTVYKNQQQPQKIVVIRADGTATYLGDTNKYSVNGTYNLVVKSTTVDDGAKYSCSSSSADGEAFANLVVLCKYKIKYT